ncbi:MAG: acyloxyacyl hydrolase [Dissulfurispiraceae bacterium]
MKTHSFLLAVIVALLTLIPDAGFGDEKSYFEMGVGAGADLQGMAAKQLILTPAFNMPISSCESLRARIEGDFELYEYTGKSGYPGKTSFVGGIAPFLRLLPFRWNVNPFVEIGVGANLQTNRNIGNHRIGGPFMFSLMSGAGIEMIINKTPISLSYRLRHLSNADIYDNNEGLNSQYIILSIGL